MLLRTALLLALSAVPLAAPAQESVPPRPAANHPVVLGGRPLFALEASFKTLTPDLRAQGIGRRVEALAKAPAFQPDSLQVAESEISSDILAGDLLVMSVFDVDALAAGKTRQELAADYAASIRQGILSYRRQFGPRRTAIGLLLTVVTIALAALLSSGVGRAGRWGQTLLDRRMERLLPAGTPGTLRRLQSDWLHRTIRLGIALVRLLLQVTLLYIAVQLILWFLPWTEAYGFQLLASVRKSLESLGKATLLRGPDLIVLALILLLARYLLRSSRYVFRQVERGNLEIPGFHPYWARPTSKLITLLLLASAAVAAYPYIPGAQSEAFKGISIFLGVLFSLGSTGVVSNVMAGSVLMYNRAFHQGDVVKIGEAVGIVADTNFFVTRLRTFKNVEVSLPNNLILSSQVVNYSHPSRSGGLVIPTALTIGYDTPWRQVHAMLELAAGRTGGIHREPPPFVLQTALGDFAVTYELNVYIEDPMRMPRVLSELHANIQDAFNEYGVQIMSPHYETDRATPAVVPRDQWYAAPARPPATDGAR